MGSCTSRLTEPQKAGDSIVEVPWLEERLQLPRSSPSIKPRKVTPLHLNGSPRRLSEIDVATARFPLSSSTPAQGPISCPSLDPRGAPVSQDTWEPRHSPALSDCTGTGTSNKSPGSLSKMLARKAWEAPSVDPPSVINTGSGPQILLSTPRPAVDVTRRGVSLRFLLSLLEAGAVAYEWSITEAVEKFVKPKTASTKCCLFDLVPDAHTGPPVYFISHLWSLKVYDLIELLKEHFDVSSSTDGDRSAKDLVWLDIVAVNQHLTAEGHLVSSDHVADTAQVIRTTRYTLLCLDAQCMVFSRLWCMYEVWRTVRDKGFKALKLLMPFNLENANLEKAVSNLSVNTAQATLPADQQALFDALVDDDLDLRDLGLALTRALVDSVRHDAEHQDTPYAHVYSRAGALLETQSRAEDALKMYRQALTLQTQVLGVTHTARVATLDKVANCLRQLGQFEEALSIYRQALDGHEKALGPNHAHTLVAVNNLASALRNNGQFEEALPLYQRALEGKQATLGVQHLSTLTAAHNLASCQQSLGRYAEALQFFEWCAHAREEQLGAEHPTTLSSLHNLARCLQNLKRYDKAAAVYQKVLNGRQHTLGEAHPDTLDSATQLVGCAHNGMQRRMSMSSTKFNQAGTSSGKFKHSSATTGRLKQRESTGKSDKLKAGRMSGGKVKDGCATAGKLRLPGSTMSSFGKAPVLPGSGPLLDHALFVTEQPLPQPLLST